MPDPKSLKVGDLIKFTATPDEWSIPGYHLDEASKEFMEAMIEYGEIGVVDEIDKDGYPWIEVDLGKNYFNFWRIIEETGWEKVDSW